MKERYAESVRAWKEQHTNWGVFTEFVYEIVDLELNDSNNSFDRGDQTPPFEENGILADGSTVRQPITVVGMERASQSGNSIVTSHPSREDMDKAYSKRDGAALRSIWSLGVRMVSHMEFPAISQLQSDKMSRKESSCQAAKSA